MPVSALITLQRLRDVSANLQYRQLLPFFDETSVVYDPFLGVHRGLDELEVLMGRMEDGAARAGSVFTDWHIEAGTTCGWSEWTLESSRDRSVVPGQSVYRLRDDKITFIASYLDTGAYSRYRTRPALRCYLESLGLSSHQHQHSPADDLHDRIWKGHLAGRHTESLPIFADDAVYVSMLDGVHNGRDEISAFLAHLEAATEPLDGDQSELLDVAGDERVGWSQWRLRLPGGLVPGWSLFAIRDDQVTYFRVCFDAVRFRELVAQLNA